MKTGCVFQTNLLESETILIFQYWADTIKFITAVLFTLAIFVGQTVGNSDT
jgi:hypothetical protein